MKTIVLKRSSRAYLPEIAAYRRYFAEYHVVEIENISELEYIDADLLWLFMGVDFHKKDIPCIHEYASLSLPPMPYLKDRIKCFFNTVPSLRVFLNNNVQKQLRFRDNVPFCYRDMGVGSSFFVKAAIVKKYDFVYVGSMERNRGLHRFMEWVKRHDGVTLLLIGNPPDDLYCEYKMCANIIFTGKVQHKDVPGLAMQAEYAVNYIPDKFPFNMQTSTKLLEYVAMGMKVVTTSYHWVNQFEKNRNMRFFHIREDCSDLDMESLRKYPFKLTNIDDLRWESVLDNSGLREAIVKLI